MLQIDKERRHKFFSKSTVNCNTIQCGNKGNTVWPNVPDLHSELITTPTHHCGLLANIKHELRDSY